jgi:hypothetical protein
MWGITVGLLFLAAATMSFSFNDHAREELAYTGSRP